MTLAGPNAGIDPNTGVRGAEAVIVPSYSDPNPFSNTAVTVITVSASNVSIQGVTVDGDNTALTNGVLNNGVDINASEAIATLDTGGSPANVTVSNNIIKDFAYAGVDLGGDFNGGAAASDNTVSHNKIDNLGGGGYGYGIGVILYNNEYAQVTDNSITRHGSVSKPEISTRRTRMAALHGDQ